METQLIPVAQVPSGVKYKDDRGIIAIKDGIKAGSTSEAMRKPDWLRMQVKQSNAYNSVRGIVKRNRLATVCEEAKCPNISECWSRGTATIMLMGDICTRACRFCSVNTGNPRGWLDPDEPANTANAVALMGLSYVVLTSVNRDDLADGGANHYAKTVSAIRARNFGTGIEVLTPDFAGDERALTTLLSAPIDVFAQNIETVKRLTHPVRDSRAGYQQTLSVLDFASKFRKGIIVKTSIMLGLGETEDELKACMDELRLHGVEVLTLGQYLQPTKYHLPVARFVSPEQFDQYRIWGLDRGFREVVSGVFVRSSYRAERVLDGNNVGL